MDELGVLADFAILCFIMKLPTIRVTILFLALCSLRLAAGTDETTIISIPSLSSACSDITNSGQEFSIEGNVVSYYRRPITGEWIINSRSCKTPKAIVI